MSGDTSLPQLVVETASGIALMYTMVEPYDDDLATRLMLAMERGDLDEIEHVSALMVARLIVSESSGADFCAQEWQRTFVASS